MTQVTYGSKLRWMTSTMKANIFHEMTQHFGAGNEPFDLNSKELHLIALRAADVALNVRAP